MINDMTYLVKEGPQLTKEGAQPVYNIRVISQSGAVPTITNDATLTMYVYKNGTDATSTFTTGAMGVSVDTITTKTLTALIGGDNLFVTVYATVNGILDCVVAFPLAVGRKSGR